MRKQFKNNLVLKKEIKYELFLLPALVGFAIFFIYPVLSSFYYSTTDWSLYNNESFSFIGLENFKRIFGDDEAFIGIINSFKWALLVTFFHNFLAIPLAVALDSKIKGKNFFRSVFFAPAVLSSLIVGYLWNYIMAPTDYGLINRVIQFFGGSNVNWLGDSNLALYSVLFTQIWQWTGWTMIIYLANLQSIPKDYYEAADIDGASGWQKFKVITIPMLAPSMTVNILLSMIGGLKVFDIIFSMTQGGPGHATETIITTLIQRGFTEGLYGYASAIGVVLFIIIAFVSLILLKFLLKREEKLI
ncbi:ABC transporter permease [Vallitalea longa]|uniref:ABC transporter permease n=1 Tax=Vallitalea longa TaxID=2936439 RepID=A0A9W5YGM8_9FIRM|nr:sugar ABC transporter permease [Vallitalea longa]GKX31584.1 ABC transporter permease [Vallitalea longa]